MADITIRKANLDDLAILLEFEQAIIRFERPFAPNLRVDPISYYDLASLIQHEDAHVVVAEAVGEIIGSGYALIKTNSAYKKPDQYVYLGFMYVKPSYRGQGVNGLIIDHLITWAQQQNLTELQLDVYAENEVALRAYKKKGFSSELLTMRLNLED